eukprot:12416765-Karenia_brevis.AAC.1
MVAPIKVAVEEAAEKFGNCLQQSVLRQCARVEERMLAVDQRMDRLDFIWMTLGRNPAAASES